MFLESIFFICFFYWVGPEKNVGLDCEQWRQANASAEEEGEGGEDATLYDGEVWLAVATTKASGELRDGFPLSLLFFLLPVSATLFFYFGQFSPR
jgi:hypothetical protein